MKSSHNLVALLFCVFMTLTACLETTSSNSGSDNGSTADYDIGGKNGGTSTLKAKIDGLTYQPQFVNAFNSTMLSSIGITASQNNGEEIGIRFSKDISAGTYPIESGMYTGLSKGIVMYYSKPNNDNESFEGQAVTGQLVITKNDIANKKVAGTFYFTTNDKGITNEPVQVWKITEGSFIVTYSDI